MSNLSSPGPNRSLTRRGFLRRTLVSAAALAGARLVPDLSGFGTRAALAADDDGGHGGRTGAIILVWLEGGASQLETFDPKPGSPISGPTRAIETSVPGVVLAHHLPQLAERAQRLALIRSVVSPEGSHERGSYLMHTGHIPNPVVAHPSLNAWCAHGLGPRELEIPRNVSILGGAPTAGLLGSNLDPLLIPDPNRPLGNIKPRIDGSRLERRLSDLEFLDRRFSRQTSGQAAKPSDGPRRAEVGEKARRFMMSDQIQAFDLTQEPASVLKRYGESEFGRGCLLARRLVAAGVPAIQVSLGNWDSHIDNFGTHERLGADLDVGLAALIDDLVDQGLWDQTLVVCATEFGRSPAINPADGRDHHPNGFSVALAGARIRGGTVVGETDPRGNQGPTAPVRVPDLMATILAGLGLSPANEVYTPEGRPIAATDHGQPIKRVLRA